MKRKVRRVMAYIRDIAYRELRDDQYIEFLELIEYEIGRELDAGEYPETDD